MANVFLLLFCLFFVILAGYGYGSGGYGSGGSGGGGGNDGSGPYNRRLGFGGGYGRR